MKRAKYGTRAKVMTEKLASDEGDTRVIVPKGISESTQSKTIKRRESYKEK